MKYKKGVAIQLEKNFKSTEFDCKGRNCCSNTLIDQMLVRRLQSIRNHFGKAVIINSGYRCSAHNKNVGGATLSKHVMGMAADIKVKGVKPREVAAYAESLGIKGIGLYDTFVHVDTRRDKYFWYGHKELPRSSFK
jgi:uncharacterized protein YcbK (DUF882 family)